jgi:hypothetical protein
MNDIVKSFDIWMPIQYCENVVTEKLAPMNVVGMKRVKLCCFNID